MTSTPQKILAFDTALFACSVALYDRKTGVYTYESSDMQRGQAQYLVPMIQGVLEKGGTNFSELDLIAVTVGPGAFTGLRIGLSTATALGLALGKPVVGLTTFDVLAQQYLNENTLKKKQSLYVLIETKRKDFYVQRFPDGKPQASQAEDILAEVQKEPDVIFIGDSLKRFSEFCPENNFKYVEKYNLLDPRVMARMACEKTAENAPPVPLYLRGPDVSLPKRKPRTIKANN